MTALTPQQMRALASDKYAWLADDDRARAALLSVAGQLEEATAVVERYAGWYAYSGEDSWRFERDIRTVLGMEQFEETTDD